MGFLTFILVAGFLLWAILASVASDVDKNEQRRGKQKRIYGSSGPYKWKEPGDYEKAIGNFFFLFGFVIIVIIIIIGIL